MKTRKHSKTFALSLLIVAIFMLGAICLIAQKKQVQAATHTHTYSWVVIKEPTCQATGRRDYVCSGCKNVSNSQQIDKVQHVYSEYLSHISGSCQTDGYDLYHCKWCSATTKKNVKKEAHRYTWVRVQEPTCTEYGRENNQCSVCKTISQSRGVEKVPHSTTVFVAHVNGNCKQDVYDVYRCQNCTYSVHTNVTKGAHSYSWVVVTSPTCTKEGIKNYKCSVCGSVTNSQTIQMVPHTIVTYREEPTYDAAGIEKKYCSQCNYVESSKVLAQLVRTCTVSFDPNNGGNVTTKTLTQGQAYGTLPGAAANNRVFLGWFTAKSGGTQVTATSTVPASATLTLYGHWSPLQYTVNYNANGGSNAPAAQTKTYNVALTLSSAKPVKTGYIFMGWSTSGSSSTVAYASGSTYTVNANMTLYAVWKADYIQITYDANGGSGAPSAVNVISRNDFHIASEVPNRIGYDFNGWVKYQSASINNILNPLYFPGQVANFASNTTLYAVWEVKTYSIIFVDTDGQDGPNAQKKVYGIDLAITTSEPVRTGYTFVGWSTSADDTVEYKGGDIYKKNADLFLYAVWKRNSLKVTYYANGGSLAPASQSTTYGSNVTLSLSIPSRTGYDFAGWATSASATTPTYFPGKTYQFTNNVNLYAVWKIKTYKIQYYANGGTGAPASQTKTYGVDLDITKGKPTRTGYSFLGWSTSSKATSATYTYGMKYTKNANTILYAVWKPFNVKITFYANGGSGAPSSISGKYGDIIVIPSSKPVRSGYTFLGWCEYKDATKASIHSSDNYMLTKTTTLFAIWQVNTYKITYFANGGVNAPASQTKVYGTPLTLSSKKPTRTGYDFVGWATDRNATTAAYESGGLFRDNKVTTLYAIWKPQKISIAYLFEDASAKIVTWDYNVEYEIVTMGSAKEGYDLCGWSTNRNAATPDYLIGQKYRFTDSYTVLYPVWKVKTYRVYFYANGGTGSPASQQKTHGEKLTLRTSIPTRVGYTFLGWAFDPMATTPVFQPGDVFEIDKTVILYAVWK